VDVVVVAGKAVPRTVMSFMGSADFTVAMALPGLLGMDYC
jgi:hypothetical protein